jgi:hypothetical protein
MLKRKAPAEAAAPVGKRGRGGGGRGAGRKRQAGLGASTAPGKQALFPGAPPPKATVSALLGKRKVPEPSAAASTAAAAADGDDDDCTEPWITWQYTEHGGGSEETMVDQRQRVGGLVRYDMASTERAKLLAKGANRTYYVDEDQPSVEVDANHERAIIMEEKNGGKLKIHVEGEEHAEWVTAGHVKAMGSAAPAEKRARTDASPRRSPRKDGSSGAQAGSSSADASTSRADSGGSPAAASPADASQGVPQGSGIKVAAKKARKPKKKQPVGATGHAWRPSWLGDNKWLRTTPSRTQAEWEDRPHEAPDNMFCICCATFPTTGHNDVMAKKKKAAVRSDKILSHRGPKHERAVVKWEDKYGKLADVCEPSAESTSPVHAAQSDPPMASLVRTVVTVAISKTATHLVPTFIDLQR